MTPAEVVVHLFGSQRNVAKALGGYSSSVSRWQQRGGFIPARAQQKLLTIAKERGLDLTAEDLILGRAQ